MKYREFTYEILVSKIINKEAFSFARTGDGEANAIFQDRKSRQNVDGHQYFPDMGKRLLQILESSPDYYIGLQNLAYRQRTEQIDELTEKHNLNWCKSDILHHANIKGRLQPFFDALNTRDVLIVGADHLKKLYPKYLKNPYFVTVPSKDCWLSYEETLKEINTLIGLKPWVICYASSMMSNVLIDDFKDSGVTQIDAGSVFDVYCDVRSRTYMKGMKV